MRRRHGQGKATWFLINPTAQAITRTIDKGGFSTVEDLLSGCLIAQTQCDFTLRVEGTDLACVLLA